MGIDSRVRCAIAPSLHPIPPAGAATTSPHLVGGRGKCVGIEPTVPRLSATSDDAAVRRRFGRLAGVLAERAESAYARRYPR